MKKINKLISGLLMALFMGLSIASLGAVPVVTAVGGTLASATVISIANYYNPVEGALRVGLLKELWTGELLKALRADTGWISELREHSQYVGNDVIHLSDTGSDPAVLINNTTYPIPSAGRTDGDITITLDKFDTENTIVTDDELYAINYNKIQSVIEQHKEVIVEKTASYGLFNLCVTADTVNTPILETTGAIEDGFKLMTISDLRKYKKRLDAIKIPMNGRVIILSTEHANGLLADSQVFRDKYHNTKTGEVINFMGFQFYESVQTPLFEGLTKASFGATPADPRAVSVGIYTPRAGKASGALDMYHDKAENNPKTRQSEIGFRFRQVMFAKSNIGFGAIISGK